MQHDQRQTDIRVGIFVLAALGLSIGGLLWIAGSGFLSDDRQGYVVLSLDSGGVQSGDRVRVAGVPVGKVRDVELRPEDGWPVRFRISLRSDVRIHTDAVAKITTSGLLGAAYLQVDPGSGTAPLLEPGAEIPSESLVGLESAMAQVDQMGTRIVELLDQTSAMVETVSADLEQVLNGAAQMMSNENVETISTLLHRLNDTMDQAGPQLTTLLTRLDSVARSAEQGLDGLPELEGKLQTLLGGLQTAIGPEGERLVGLIDTAQGSLQSADDALAILGQNRYELDATLRDLRDTMANLKSFSQTINERPYSLVRIQSPPQRVPGQGVK